MDLSGILWAVARAAVAPESAVLALAAVGLNLHYGYTGLLNFGQAGFMMVGAYGLAIGVVTLGWPFWGGIALGLALSLLLALLLGVPTLRLRSDYFAIVSLALAESLRLLFRSRWMEPVTGGVGGLQRFGNHFYAQNPLPQGEYGMGPWQWNEAQLFLLIVAWSLVLLTSGFTWMLMRSPWGRVLRSIKDNEIAPQALGKPVFLYKMQSLVLGGLVGSLAGIVLALNQQDVNPETYAATLTFFAFTALILGGMGRTRGPVLGALMFWGILAFTDGVMASLAGGPLAQWLSAQQLGSVRFILVGIGLMALVLYLPDGVFGRARKAHRDAR